jgi:hypothetical protein
MVLSVSMDVSSTSYFLHILSFSTPAHLLIRFLLPSQSSEKVPLTLSIQTVDVNLPHVSKEPGRLHPIPPCSLHGKT